MRKGAVGEEGWIQQEAGGGVFERLATRVCAFF
jgi:hypothetical protein